MRCVSLCGVAGWTDKPGWGPLRLGPAAAAGPSSRPSGTPFSPVMARGAVAGVCGEARPRWRMGNNAGKKKKCWTSAARRAHSCGALEAAGAGSPIRVWVRWRVAVSVDALPLAASQSVVADRAAAAAVAGRWAALGRQVVSTVSSTRSCCSPCCSPLSLFFSSNGQGRRAGSGASGGGGGKGREPERRVLWEMDAWVRCEAAAARAVSRPARLVLLCDTSTAATLGRGHWIPLPHSTSSSSKGLLSPGLAPHPRGTVPAAVPASGPVHPGGLCSGVPLASRSRWGEGPAGQGSVGRPT